jgi:hypothetical protein
VSAVIRILTVAAFLVSASLIAQQPTGPVRTVVLSATPPVTTTQVAAIEQQILASPGDLELRAQLLRLYAAGSAQPGLNYRAARLDQIRYLINEAPASSLAGSSLAYVGSATGPYPDPGDHAAMASLWIAETNSHFDDTKILLNAIRFLGIEDKSQDENLYRNAIAARPADVEVAASLGFFYATGLVAADTLDGRVLATRTTAVDSSWTDHCRAQLDSSTNPHVLMGASIALPNVAMRRTGGGPAYEAWVQYSEELRNRVSAIDPVAAGAGAMPIEFRIFAAESAPPPPDPPTTRASPASPDEIRVGANVMAANLISNPAPEYPPLALQAGIQGVVRFQARIGTDGKIKTLQLVSGPPLLVQAAMQAVQQWTWRQTILDNAPVGVITTVEVPFTLPAR